MLDTVRDCGGFNAELLAEPNDWRDERLHLSDRPGLSVEVDEAAVRASPNTSDGLHLAMAPDPIEVADPNRAK